MSVVNYGALGCAAMHRGTRAGQVRARTNVSLATNTPPSCSTRELIIADEQVSFTTATHKWSILRATYQGLPGEEVRLGDRACVPVESVTAQLAGPLAKLRSDNSRGSHLL